jgi:hypothetical protein
MRPEAIPERHREKGLPFSRPTPILVFLPMLRVEVNLIAPRWLEFFPTSA